MIQAGTDYGDLAPLMKSVGWAASAAAAILLTAFGIKTAWAPLEEEIPGGHHGFAFLITAGLLGGCGSGLLLTSLRGSVTHRPVYRVGCNGSGICDHTFRAIHVDL